MRIKEGFFTKNLTILCNKKKVVKFTRDLRIKEINFNYLDLLPLVLQEVGEKLDQLKQEQEVKEKTEKEMERFRIEFEKKEHNPMSEAQVEVEVDAFKFNLKLEASKLKEKQNEKNRKLSSPL